MRALLVTVLTPLVQLALASLLAALLGSSVPLAAAGLLLGATELLGALVALRDGLRSIAPVVQLVACALLLVPRAATGSIAPALAVLVAVALVLPASCWAWSWARSFRPTPASWAPILGVAWLGAASCPSVVVAWSVAASAPLFAVLAFALMRRLDAREALELSAWVEHVAAIEVGPDAWRRPEAPSAASPLARHLEDVLQTRARELSASSRDDAHAREQIADARAMRTRFMAAMGHELRSPLNSIVGFAQLLERGLDGPMLEPQMESIGLVRRSAEELISLLNDVLDLARLEAGRLKLRQKWTPSVEILTEAVRGARQIAEARQIEIEAVMQPGLPPVFGDPERIVQAVVALFRSTSPRRTTVRMVARVASGPPGPAEQLRVEIHDALGALSNAEVARIFEAFQEINEPTGRRVGGLGMALTLARGLVRLHGGEVWADTHSEAGTVLCVAIPLHHDQAS